MQYTTSGPHWPEGQPAVSGDDELRPADGRGGQLSRSWTGRWSTGSTSSTPPTSTAGRRAKASPSRSSAAGSPRAAAGARRSSWRPRSTATMGDWPNAVALSALHIRQACEGACAGCRPTTSTCTRCTTSTATRPWEEIWQAMELLVQQGKVIYVGSSNFAGWHIAQANEAAQRRALPRPGLRAEPVQPERPDGRAGGDARLPGVRPGRHPVEPARRRPAGRRRCRRPPEGRRASTKACRSDRAAPRRSWRSTKRSARELGEQPADVALAWLLNNPVVTAPIIGPRTMDQLDGALRALEIELSPEMMARLDELFPGPGGEAPEAYAW